MLDFIGSTCIVVLVIIGVFWLIVSVLKNI